MRIERPAQERQESRLVVTRRGVSGKDVDTGGRLESVADT